MGEIWHSLIGLHDLRPSEREVSLEERSLEFLLSLPSCGTYGVILLATVGYDTPPQ